MHQLTENRPETCFSVGLDCGECVRHSATTVAAICQGLQPAGIHQIFFQLYPSTGCHPMAQAFERAYAEMSTPSKPMARASRADAAAAA
jgi:hypothetical protein